MTHNEISDALAKHLVWVRMANGNLWRLRRNGATKLWKTRPSEYRIPVKAGLKSHGYITEDSEIVIQDDGRYIVERA